MIVFGGSAPVELSLDIFRVLMMFVEKITIREAYHSLNVDVDIEEFARIVGSLVDRGLLMHEQYDNAEDGLQQLLRPNMFSDATLLDRIGAWLRRGHAIAIPNALSPDLAERVYIDLDRSSSWRPVETSHDFFFIFALVRLSA
jgi:hypothetical protein